MQYRFSRPHLAFLGVLLVTAAACSGGNSNPPAGPLSPTAPSSIGESPVAPDATIVAAGDVAVCGRAEVEATARLIDGIHGVILGLGDLAYPDGSARDFATCYEPTWGRHRGRTRPIPGNHEYHSAGGAAYFDYFGESAGPRGMGYYSFRAGSWLVIALNSNIPADANSAQATWLRATLAEQRTKCTLAYWHHPVFSSGPHGNSGTMRDAWQILQDAGADVVLAAHDHIYERFAPQTAGGRADVAGLRQFTVGTGGAVPTSVRTPAGNSEIVGTEEGVLRMTLRSDSYVWQFVPIAGRSFSDVGSASCR